MDYLRHSFEKKDDREDNLRRQAEVIDNAFGMFGLRLGNSPKQKAAANLLVMPHWRKVDGGVYHQAVTHAIAALQTHGGCEFSDSELSGRLAQDLYRSDGFDDPVPVQVVEFTLDPNVAKREGWQDAGIFELLVAVMLRPSLRLKDNCTILGLADRFEFYEDERSRWSMAMRFTPKCDIMKTWNLEQDPWLSLKLRPVA